jgi:hypothetical protein
MIRASRRSMDLDFSEVTAIKLYFQGHAIPPRSRGDGPSTYSSTWGYAKNWVFSK